MLLVMWPYAALLEHCEDVCDLPRLLADCVVASLERRWVASEVVLRLALVRRQLLWAARRLRER
ncbi:hypothetical protein [Mumia zhuanghuii]|uniref:Uncharacterized protein n=1 Tax=Mumia zhuanghuii TaxID=2585211 RepID=A0A5C4LSN5_9ACTN|nr:hypothetical protein [Mumia zhuanghuii]TNC22035.1 hypothetical protein FHE65_36180 [Mumia zhuanghuii]TNC22188.1 hypothetical protein FHE65_35915 [Mumia zhuanghuii]